jgi:hypothetical protein
MEVIEHLHPNLVILVPCCDLDVLIRQLVADHLGLPRNIQQVAVDRRDAR